MLEDKLKPYGCTITSKPIFGGGKQSITIDYPSIKLISQFVWDSTQKSFEIKLAPRIHKLMCAFCNGARLIDGQEYGITSFEEFIVSNNFQTTPEIKLEELLFYINSLTTYDGQAVELKSPTMTRLAQMNFNNILEWKFYLNTATSAMFITRTSQVKSSMSTIGEDNYIKYALTVNGLSKLIKASEGKDSKNCFVAMAFAPAMFNILEESIKPALIACGFSYTVVSEEHIDSDTTINDAILAGIKKANFMIADFTFHRGGVYFEAGYGLGRGKKVIYCCSEEQMHLAHFDIRNYQHVVWKDAFDFKNQLINKIDAFIKE